MAELVDARDLKSLALFLYLFVFKAVLCYFCFARYST